MLEAETEKGLVCCHDLVVGADIYLEKEDGSLESLAIANLEVMDGVFITAKDGKITDVDPRNMMKDIRLAG